MLRDEWGHIAFLFAHIPLFFFIFWQLTHHQNIGKIIQGFDVLMMIHMLAHILLLKHKNNLFKDWISWRIIIGASICGGWTTGFRCKIDIGSATLGFVQSNKKENPMKGQPALFSYSMFSPKASIFVSFVPFVLFCVSKIAFCHLHKTLGA
jgi:hypothetical protein